MLAQVVRWVPLGSEILFVHLLCILFLTFRNRLKWCVIVKILSLLPLTPILIRTSQQQKDIRKLLFVFSSISKYYCEYYVGKNKREREREERIERGREWGREGGGYSSALERQNWTVHYCYPFRMALCLLDCLAMSN